MAFSVVAEHTPETDEIIRRHGTEIGKAATELTERFGGGWYWKKIRKRAVELGVLSPEANLIAGKTPKVCIHTEETDAIIRKHNGNVKQACIELKWGNNRAVRARAIELGIIEDVKRKGGPPLKYIPTPETDAVLFKHPQQIQRCALLLKWDTAAVRRRMVELGIIKKGRKINRRKYKHTKKTDDLIREYRGHVGALRDILGWPSEVILQRAIELNVRKKGEHLPRDYKYVKWNAIDDVIRKYKGFVRPIQDETGWGPEAIRKRADELGVSPAQRGEKYTYQKMYIPTPEVDAIITECLKEKYRNGGALRAAEERIKEHAKATKTPRWSEGAIVARARELGLTTARKTYGGTRWSEGENKLILENAHLTIPTIQRKLEDKFPFSNRTQSAIQMQKQRLTTEYGKLTYTLKELAANLHMNDSTVVKLTMQGIIEGTYRETERQDGNVLWSFTPKAIQKFILTYPEMVDFALVNKFWLLDIVSGGKLGKQNRENEIKATVKKFYSDELTPVL